MLIAGQVQRRACRPAATIEAEGGMTLVSYFPVLTRKATQMLTHKDIAFPLVLLRACELCVIPSHYRAFASSCILPALIISGLLVWRCAYERDSDTERISTCVYV